MQVNYSAVISGEVLGNVRQIMVNLDNAKERDEYVNLFSRTFSKYSTQIKKVG